LRESGDDVKVRGWGDQASPPEGLGFRIMMMMTMMTMMIIIIVVIMIIIIVVIMMIIMIITPYPKRVWGLGCGMSGVGFSGVGCRV